MDTMEVSGATVEVILVAGMNSATEVVIGEDHQTAEVTDTKGLTAVVAA